MRIPRYAAFARVGRVLGASLGATLLSRWGTRAPRPALATAALTAVVFCTVLALNAQSFRRYRRPLENDQHALMSLEMAVHRQRFGAVSHIFLKPTPRGGIIQSPLANDAAMLERPLRDLPRAYGMTEDDYPRVLEPYVNNENSLMLVDRAVLAVAPDVTPAGMVRAQLALKAACLAVFVFFLIRAGFSPVFALAACHAAFRLVVEVNQVRPVSLYPWLLPVLLLLVSLLGLCLSFGLHRRLVAHLPAMLGVGLAGAFLVNLRSSYAPVVVALYLLYALVAAWDLCHEQGLARLRAGLLAAGALAACGVGYLAFTVGFISPLTAVTRDARGPVLATYTHHVVAHPLVLFLAVPPNDLARREGIEYDDLCGLKLARRLDPSVGYLRGNYDAALFAYYRRLWREHPREMLGVYRAKFGLAAVSTMQAVLAPGPTWAGPPLRALARWPVYLALFAALAAAPLFLGRGLTAARAFALSALAVAALLLFLELAALSSRYSSIYNSYLGFWLLLLGLLASQAVLDGGFAALGRLVKRAGAGPVSATARVPGPK
jgi:hypothetical protein